LEKLKEKFNIYDNKWYGIEIINEVIGTNEIIDANKESREIEHILGFTDAAYNAENTVGMSKYTDQKEVISAIILKSIAIFKPFNWKSISVNLAPEVSYPEFWLSHLQLCHWVQLPMQYERDI
jgi:hypothetical protein